MDQSLYLFGACHRDCVAQAAEQIRAGKLSPSAKDLPRLTIEDADDLSYQLHLPADDLTCPFCGGSGSLTDEHVWPRWLSREIVRQGGSFISPPGSARSPKSIEPAVGVCRQCNNNWMSTMENDVSAIARPMLCGDFVYLDKSKQSLLATWATKTAYMIDRLTDRIVPRGYPMDLAIRRQPPNGTRVWLGAYDGSLAASAALEPLALGAVSGESQRAANGYAATFTAHKIAFQVVGHFTRGETTVKDQRHGLREGIVQIWPVQDSEVTWPPKLIMSDAWISALAESLQSVDRVEGM